MNKHSGNRKPTRPDSSALRGKKRPDKWDWADKIIQRIRMKHHFFDSNDPVRKLHKDLAAALRRTDAAAEKRGYEHARKQRDWLRKPIDGGLDR